MALKRSRRLVAESLEHRRLLAGDSFACHNADMPLDVTGDSRISALDALNIIADLNAHGPHRCAPGDGAGMVDTNGDGSVTSRDVLLIFEALSQAEGEDGDKVRMRLEATAPNSFEPITTIDPNSDFVLRAYVEDITGRAANVGVFAGYLDVTYTANLADVTGAIEYGENYPAGQTGDTNVDGLVDEVGAFATSFTAIGPGEVLLFSLPMRTEGGTGTLTFMGDPADILPASETLLYFGPGESPDVAVDEIEFVGTSLQVGDAAGGPVAVSDMYNGSEDELLIISARGVLDNDSGGDGLAAVKLTDPVNGTVELQPDGSFVYTPDPDFNGTDSFTYAATLDGATSDPATVTLDIAPLNDAPFAQGETFSTPLNTTLFRPADEGLLVNDTDVDSSTLTVVLPLVSAPANGVVSVTPEGAFAYVPTQGFVGTDTFEYMVSDGQATSEPVIATIIVGAGDAPIAEADSYQTNEDTTLIRDAAAGVLANDSNAVSAELVDDAIHGTLTLNPDGSFDYTPDPDFNGTDGFTYVASDGLIVSDPATVTITVIATSDAPRTTDDFYATSVNTSLEVPAPGLLANDLDPDGEAITALLLAEPVNGEVTLNSDGSFVYTPAPEFTGTDSFTYVAQDGFLTSPRPGTVTITVTSDENFAPVANDDQYEVTAGQPVSVSAANGLLANDTDANGDVLGVAEVVSGPDNGVLTVESNGAFTYAPDEGFIGTDSFVYLASDGFVTSEPATVTLDVSEGGTLVAILVRATDASGNPLTTLNSGDTFELRVYVEDVSPEPRDGVFAAFTDVTFESSLAFAIGDVVAGPNFTNGATGDIATPGLINEAGGFDVSPLGPGEFLLFKVPMRARGAGNLSFATDPADQLPEGDVLLFDSPDAIPTDQIDYGTTSVFVNPLPQPVANADQYDAPDNTPLTVSAAAGVLSNDLGTGGPLAAELVTEPEHGSVTLNADGSFVYTPDAGFAGNDSFTYQARATDDNKVSDPAEVTLAVGNLTPGSISGSIYFDVNNNGKRDSFGTASERGFGGVSITLVGTDLFGIDVMDTQVTDKDGNYAFTGLLRGQYTIVQGAPAVVIDGLETGGLSTTNDEIVIDLPAATNYEGVNFGERGLRPGYYSLPNFFSSRMPGGASVALHPNGTQSWFSLDEGWSQFESVTLNLSSDGSTVTITATDQNGIVFVGTASTSNSNVAVFGNQANGILIQFLDPSSAYGLQAVITPSAAAVDAAFALIF